MAERCLSSFDGGGGFCVGASRMAGRDRCHCRDTHCLIPKMTMSIAARCPLTGMVGVAVASSSIAVASRCAHVRAGIGAALSQNVTDPSLGRLALDQCRADARRSEEHTSELQS